MSSQVAATEDAIIECIEAQLGDHVRTVEYAPPDWDVDYIKRIFKRLPGVFVIFGGGQKIPGTGTPRMLSHWTIVAATGHAQDAKTRARGALREIGCYEMLELILPKLNGMTVFRTGEKKPEDAVGTLEFSAWDNDMALQLETQGLMTQSLTFTMPMAFEASIDESLLVPFIRFHAEYDVDQLPGAPRTDDMVVLPQ